MRKSSVAAFAACGVAIGLLGTGTSYAASVVTTGGAASVKNTSATLTGTLNVSDADSAWTFEYGPTTARTFHTPFVTIGNGTHTVVATVTGLAPGTTYHYRLVLVQGSYAGQFEAGADMTFTTAGSGPSRRPSFGRTSLSSHRFTVINGFVSIPVKCTGGRGALCQGRVSLSARGRHGKKVACGGGRFAMTAGARLVVNSDIGRACAALLRKARHHRLAAALSGLVTSHQGPLHAGVKLVGS